MKTFIRTLSALALAGTTVAHAQTFTAADVLFWVGTGSDSTVLVIDFQDGTNDPSYAWGWLHNGGTAAQMLDAVVAADPNLWADVANGFLSSLTYGDHAGLGGDPDWWSTWSGTSMDDMTMNMGISEELANGSWFALSYTDFEPALEPGIPVAAFDPLAFTAADVQFWVGSGPDTTLLVIDFQDGTGNSSFAWGYLHPGGTTAEEMLNDVAAADPRLQVVIPGGFLSDASFDGHEGIGGQPDWWSTWGATNLGNWTMNMGLATELGNGDLFGLSYTDFSPALRPGIPTAVGIPTGLATYSPAGLRVWPQPATTVLYVEHAMVSKQPLHVYNMAGERVIASTAHAPLVTVQVKELAPGMYVLHVGQTRQLIAVQ